MLIGGKRQFFIPPSIYSPFIATKSTRVELCRYKRALMRYRFPYVSADLHKQVRQPGIQRTLRDHGYGMVCHAICLFTALAFAGYSFQPNHRERAQVLHQGGFPSQRRSPT